MKAISKVVGGFFTLLFAVIGYMTVFNKSFEWITDGIGDIVDYFNK